MGSSSRPVCAYGLESVNVNSLRLLPYMVVAMLSWTMETLLSDVKLSVNVCDAGVKVEAYTSAQYTPWFGFCIVTVSGATPFPLVAELAVSP